MNEYIPLREAKIPEEKVLKALRQMAKKLGKTPTTEQVFNARKANEFPAGLGYIYRHFGSYKNAVRLAGLPPTYYQEGKWLVRPRT